MNPPTDNFDESQDGTQRTGSNLEVSSRFQCPACRARQPLQNECRRCQADLSLVVAARHRIDFVRKQLRQSTAGSPAHDRFTTELQGLTGTVSPNIRH